MISKVRKRYSFIKQILDNGYYLKKTEHGAIKKNVVLAESKSGEDIAGNILYLLKELECPAFCDYKVYLAVTPQSRAHVTDVLEKYGIKRVKLTAYNGRSYRRLLATAEFLVNDLMFPSWFLKREEQTYLNTGDGTPFLYTGKDEEDRAYAIGNMQMNLINADYILFSSEYAKNITFQAYMLENIFKGKVICEGALQNSVFFSRERALELRRELHWDNKQISIYIPDGHDAADEINAFAASKASDDNKAAVFEEALACMFDALDDLLREDQIVYVKLHKSAEEAFSFDDYRHIKSLPEDYDVHDLLNASDVFITDHSKMIFDYMNLHKKIILFSTSEDDYMRQNNTYTKPAELPFLRAFSAKELADAIHNEKTYADADIIEKFCSYDQKDSADRLARHILKRESCCTEIDYSDGTRQKKECVLIYGGNLKKNGITTSLLNLMSLLDKEHTDYYFTFHEHLMKKTPSYLSQLPKEACILPVSGSIENMNLKELIAYRLFFRYGKDTEGIFKTVRGIYQREYRKRFEKAGFSKIIHFTGYAPDITMLFLTSSARKLIFAHNLIYEEIAEKGNQHLPTLRHAYQEYDKVVAVSQSVKASLVKICPNQDNVVILENAHDDKRVREKADELLNYDSETFSTVSRDELQKILDSDDLKFVTMGRFSEEKGHGKLIAAFARFHETHKLCRLIIIGGYGELFEKTMAAAKESGCAEDIIIIRSISNPFPILKACDLFILSSNRESLGLVVLEADTLGVPVIATDIAGSGEFIKKHGGYLVPNSEAGLVLGMEDFINGKVQPMNISFKQYNEAVVRDFETLVRGTGE